MEIKNFKEAEKLIQEIEKIKKAVKDASLLNNIAGFPVCSVRIYISYISSGDGGIDIGTDQSLLSQIYEVIVKENEKKLKIIEDRFKNL